MVVLIEKRILLTAMLSEIQAVPSVERDRWLRSDQLHAMPLPRRHVHLCNQSVMEALRQGQCTLGGWPDGE